MIRSNYCFAPGALTPADVISLVEAHDVGFDVEQVRIGRKRVPVSPETLAAASDATNGRVRLSGENGELTLAFVAAMQAQLLTSKTERRPAAAFVDALVARPGFVCSLIGDADDVFWQSAHQTNTYEVFGKEWKHLPTVYSEVLREDIIDVSGNPGRQSAGPGMRLWAAASMVFGPVAFSVLDREQLAACPVGDVVPRPDGAIAIELFSVDDDMALIRERQRAFREWMDYDRIESLASQMLAEMTDPSVEFEEGSFEHGGVRLVSEWLDDGDLVAKSKATSVRRVELSRSGEILWQATVPV